MEIIRDIENLEINEEIGKFGWIKRSVDLGDIGDFKGYRGTNGNTIDLEYHGGYRGIWGLRGILWIKWDINGYSRIKKIWRLFHDIRLKTTSRI